MELDIKFENGKKWDFGDNVEIVFDEEMEEVLEGWANSFNISIGELLEELFSDKNLFSRENLERNFKALLQKQKEVKNE